MEKGGWGYLSFTALDRINEIEFALKNKMYQSALALTLTLPDICGQVEMPSARVGARYKSWFDQYVAPLYIPKYIADIAAPQKRIIDGSVCYRLRCSYLHAGSDFIKEMEGKNAIRSEEDAAYKISYHLFLTIDEDSADGIECNTDNSTKEREYIVHINVPTLCRKVCEAARNYIQGHSNPSAFNKNIIWVFSSKKWKQDSDSFFQENE